MTASRALRDPNNDVIKLEELDEIINAGIDALAEFYPKEIVTSPLTVVSGLSSYALPASITSVYRVDLYSNGTYVGTMPPSHDGPTGGWENHGGYLFIPPFTTAGYTMVLFGYGPWTQLTTPNSVSDLPSTAITAVMVYIQVEIYDRMQLDRVMFQEWVAISGNNDVSLLQLFRIAANWHARWDRERVRLRRLRKQG